MLELIMQTNVFEKFFENSFPYHFDSVEGIFIKNLIILLTICGHVYFFRVGEFSLWLYNYGTYKRTAGLKGVLTRMKEFFLTNWKGTMVKRIPAKVIQKLTNNDITVLEYFALNGKPGQYFRYAVTDIHFGQILILAIDILVVNVCYKLLILLQFFLDSCREGGLRYLFTWITMDSSKQFSPSEEIIWVPNIEQMFDIRFHYLIYWNLFVAFLSIFIIIIMIKDIKTVINNRINYQNRRIYPNVTYFDKLIIIFHYIVIFVFQMNSTVMSPLTIINHQSFEEIHSWFKVAVEFLDSFFYTGFLGIIPFYKYIHYIGTDSIANVRLGLTLVSCFIVYYQGVVRNIRLLHVFVRYHLSMVYLIFVSSTIVTSFLRAFVLLGKFLSFEITGMYLIGLCYFFMLLIINIMGIFSVMTTHLGFYNWDLDNYATSLVGADYAKFWQKKNRNKSPVSIEEKFERFVPILKDENFIGTELWSDLNFYKF